MRMELGRGADDTALATAPGEAPRTPPVPPHLAALPKKEAPRTPHLATEGKAMIDVGLKQLCVFHSVTAESLKADWHLLRDLGSEATQLTTNAGRSTSGGEASSTRGQGGGYDAPSPPRTTRWRRRR